jgi:hypothetical protein
VFVTARDHTRLIFVGKGRTYPSGASYKRVNRRVMCKRRSDKRTSLLHRCLQELKVL